VLGNSGEIGRGTYMIMQVTRSVVKVMFVGTIQTPNLMLASLCIIIQFKQINQLDAAVSQVYYLAFTCGSTCFVRLHVHHQELTTALTASGFTVGARW
jgi:hypothetical protein